MEHGLVTINKVCGVKLHLCRLLLSLRMDVALQQEEIQLINMGQFLLTFKNVFFDNESFLLRVYEVTQYCLMNY